MNPSKIYLASSWRNPDQPDAIAALRSAGHEVYDFRNPTGGIPNGFRWSELDPDWEAWSAKAYREKLKSPLAQRGFDSDFDGMKWADIGILLLPCGRGAGHSTTEIECFGMPPTVMILGQSPPDALGRPGMIMDSFVPKLRVDRPGCSLHKPKMDFATTGRS